MTIWKPNSWRYKPAKHIPEYVDQEKLYSVLNQLSNFPPLVFAGESRSLKEHLAKRCRIEPGGKKVMVMSEGKKVELFNDVWRTAGAGQQKVASHFGQGMINCMTEKVKKVDA